MNQSDDELNYAEHLTYKELGELLETSDEYGLCYLYAQAEGVWNWLKRRNGERLAKRMASEGLPTDDRHF